MSIKLKKEQIRLYEALCSPYCQTTVENDIIVPDVKPDILRVLQVDSNAIVTQKNIQNDKIYLQGMVKFTILYIPDNGILGAIKSIMTCQEFNHTLDVKGAKPGMELCVDIQCEPADFTLVNSRKLNIRNKISLSIRLSGIKEIGIATGIEEPVPIETRGVNMKIYNPSIDTARDIIIRERLEVPAGKPALGEILKITPNPVSTELRLLADKAVIKGELKVCVLYCSYGEDPSPEVMEHTVPFSEILEIEGLSENMVGEIDYVVKDIFFEICQDSDGDNRILGCEFNIEALVRAFEAVECSALSDAYSLEHPLDIQKEAYKIEQLLENATAENTIKEQIHVPDYLPEIIRLCDCDATPTIENVSLGEDCVTVSGYINCNILYLSEDTSSPVAGFAHVLPFSHTFRVEGITPSSLCDAKAEMQHAGYTITSGKEIEFRGIISIGLKVINPIDARLISSINQDEATLLPKAPSMRVYFVQKGDTLWDIAKRYRTSKDAILSANGPEEEIIKPGKCIYIFK